LNAGERPWFYSATSPRREASLFKLGRTFGFGQFLWIDSAGSPWGLTRQASRRNAPCGCGGIAWRWSPAGFLANCRHGDRAADVALLGMSTIGKGVHRLAAAGAAPAGWFVLARPGRCENQRDHRFPSSAV